MTRGPERRAVAGGSRRGQSLLIALAILFLLILVGGIFITLILRNLQRVARQSSSDDALQLALAGLSYSANQFRTSPTGSDWRPTPTEPLWRDPIVPDLNANGGNADELALRQRDPDYEWLEPARQAGRPFTRIPSGRGRFLIRLTYLPVFRPASQASEAANRADEFDTNSQLCHIEVIGRPGEFDPTDPTSFVTDPTTVRGPDGIPGPFRKVEAFVPIGLVDQLWWITNFTNERGPAKIGVPPYRDGNDRLVEYSTLFSGGIRSNVSLQWHGRNVIRVYPARGESLAVKGNLLLAPPSSNQSSSGAGRLRADFMEDNGQAAPPQGGRPTIPGDDQDDNAANDAVIISVAAVESTNPAFDPVLLYSTGRADRFGLRDEAHLRFDPILGTRSTRIQAAPLLNQNDPTTGINRYILLTRESGGQITLQDGRRVNAGLYALLDPSLPPQIRARGLYLNNFDDIQYRTDRRGVVGEWLRRGSAETRNRGWVADTYVPSVVSEGILHPITEVLLTRDGAGNPVIAVTRFDLDVQQLNAAGATGRQSQFHRLTGVVATSQGGSGTLVPVGQTQVFPYPDNGVFFAEGSLRIRGVIGTATAARQLTVVSGGTIYVEGNLLKARRDSYLGLLAKDYVTLNPTAFTRIRPGDDVIVEADTFDSQGAPIGWHYLVPQGGDLDFTASDALGFTDGWLHVKHSAVQEDASSETAVTMLLPPLLARYDFGANVPPVPPPPPDPPYTGLSQFYYLFKQISAGAPNNWAESPYQTAAGSPANFERKTFFLPTVPTTPGEDVPYRFLVGPKDPGDVSLNGQPWWLSRLALMPQGRPLSIRVDAVIYAFTGSWFVIPPPFFNENQADTRANFQATGLRAGGTFPKNTDHYPFFNEPLDIDIHLIGSVSENFPAEPTDSASWMSRLWMLDPGYDHTAFPLQPRPAFSPNLRYTYDADMRRMVRVRFTRPYAANGTRREEVVWTAPGAPPPGIRLYSVVLAEALNNNSYVETLPLLPHLPAAAVVYEGRPLQ